MRLIIIVLFALSAGASGAAGIEWVGSVGNSGGNGEPWSIVKSTIGRSGGGVVVDHAGRIFTGGGNCILTLNKDGKLLWSTPMPQKGWVLGGPYSAISGKYLYFIAGVPVPRVGPMELLSIPWAEVETNICRVEMHPGAAPQVLVPNDKSGCTDIFTSGEVAIQSDPTDGAVYVGHGLANSSYGVYRVNDDGTLTTQFINHALSGRFGIDESGHWYIGTTTAVREIDKNGIDLPGTQPMPMPQMPSSVASSWHASTMLTRGYIWDMGILGFVGRFSRQMQPDPGAVTHFDQTLYYTAQIADAPNDQYYVKSSSGLYLGKIDKGQLVLTRRFNSISYATALCLLPDGFMGVGNDQTNFDWYDFSDDDASAAPIQTQFTGPTAQGYVDGETFYTYQIGDYNAPLDYSPGSTTLSMATYQANLAEGSVVPSVARGTYPVAQIAAVTHAGNWVFALDTKLNQLLRGAASAPCTLTPVSVANDVPVATMTSITNVGSDTLLIGTDSGIRICTIGSSGELSVRSTFQPPDAEGTLGKHVYLASDGNRIVIVDTDRDRLLVVRADDTKSNLAFEAQFGGSDSPGSDDAHLSAPTLTAISNGRIVVFDTGNQRVEKLRLHE